jgi:hypothetical protein
MYLSSQATITHIWIQFWSLQIKYMVNPFQKLNSLRLIWFYEFLGVIDIKKSKSVGENWISCYKINGSEDDFMKKLYDHGTLIWCHMIQGTNETRLIFWAYVSVIVSNNVEQHGAQVVGRQQLWSFKTKTIYIYKLKVLNGLMLHVIGCIHMEFTSDMYDMLRN